MSGLEHKDPQFQVETTRLNARQYCAKQKALYWHSQQSSNIVKCRLHVWSKQCSSCLLLLSLKILKHYKWKPLLK